MLKELLHEAYSTSDVNQGGTYYDPFELASAVEKRMVTLGWGRDRYGVYIRNKLTLWLIVITSH